MKLQVLNFEGHHLERIERDGEVWLRLQQIAVALGYSRNDVLQQLHARHADEFTDSMTALVDFPTSGGVQKTRIFSLRGAHLLGMFAKTEAAKRFRQWVLDVLEGKAASVHPAAQADYDLIAVLETRLAHSLETQALLKQLAGVQALVIELTSQLTKPKRTPARPITEEEIKMARAMKAQGVSLTAIAKQLGRSIASISMLTRELH